jgi:hypothetical protein
MDPELEFAEEWLPVVGYEGWYEVSNLGRIRSVPRLHLGRWPSGCWNKGKILRLQLSENGYLRIELNKDKSHRTFPVHRLVSEAFIGPCPLGKQMDHIDGNKLNNMVGNLEYVTPKENIRRATILGNRRPSKGEQHYAAKLTDSQISEIRRLKIEGVSDQKLGQTFGVSRRYINKIVNMQRRT